MDIKDLVSYIENRLDGGLEKIDVSCAVDEFATGNVDVIKTKETYVVATEQEADEIINYRRQIDGFEAASKKYKAGKMNKAGEVVKPETWTVVIKLNH